MNHSSGRFWGGLPSFMPTHWKVPALKTEVPTNQEEMNEPVLDI